MNLLYPYGKENIIELSDDTYRNLALDEIVDMIAVTSEDKELIRSVFRCLPTDDRTSLYRQEIIGDLLDSKELCSELGEILQKLGVLKEYNMHSHFLTRKKASLWDLIDYMCEMDVYIQVIEELNALFDKYTMKSRGLNEIKQLLGEVVESDRIADLKELVSSLKAEISTLKSVTVGINLTPELYPAEVFVLNYNTLPIESPYTKVVLGMSIALRRRVTYTEPTPFMKHICDDMERHLSKSVQTYKNELKKCINFKGYFLLDICNDLKFCLMLTKFGRKLKEEGYKLSFPRIDDSLETVKIKGIYNIRLADSKTEKIVPNDFEFTPKEKIFILTGPNRGGKTMLTQAVGITALMAGLGLFVPADEYEGFPFKNIFTHFPADENETIDLGRLGEEAVRVKNIVSCADERTLVLFNETYSSTSATDGLYLAKDLVHILKHKGVPTIFNTHIHELARQCEEMNSWEGTSVVSLTMEIVNNVNTYRVLRKEPDCSSYAHNIAFKYGVTFEQMLG